jgi:hypothetical protein
VLVSIDGVTRSLLVITSVNELCVLPVIREGIADVSGFIVLSALIDDSELGGMKIDVRSPFPVVVNNVDVLSKMLTVVDIASLLEDL